MLVDLGATTSAVSRVRQRPRADFMTLERYSHVMHLVSVVDGKLDDRHDRLDALVACFPAGTVSGAPKVRAMEIIAELEPSGVASTPALSATWTSPATWILHHHPHRGDRERPRLRPGRRRHRRRFEPHGRVRGDARTRRAR